MRGIALKKGVDKSEAGVYNVNIKGCAAHGRLLSLSFLEKH